MAKATFHRRFNATDTTKGVSLKIEPTDSPKTFPAWMIDLAVKAGAATRDEPKAASAAQTE